MPGFILNDGAVVPPSVYSAMNTVLNKKLGTSQVYQPRDWAAIVKDLVPLPLKTASGSIASFSDGADTVPLKSLTYRFPPTQAGAGDPSPNNPRTINAVTTANVVHTGANLLNVSTGTIGVWIDSSGNETTSLQGYVSDYIKTTGTTIKTNVFKQGDISFFSCSICEYDKDKQFIRRDHHTTTTLSSEISDTLSNTTAFVKFQINLNGGMTQTALDNGDIMVSFDSATTYEPYASTSHTIDFGTVYGGEGDEEGEFSSEYGIVLDLSALSWTYQSANNRFVSTDIASLVKAPPNNSTVVENALCEIYKVDISNNTASSAYDNIIAVSSAGNLQIRDTSLSGDLDALATRLNGIKFVYPLATPTTLSVDPVAISSRYGANNIYLDLAGSECEVEYYADPTLSTQ